MVAAVLAAVRRALIYRRLSRNRNGSLSPNVQYQDDDGRAHAADRGYEVVGSYWDDDTPASKENYKPRPGYEALLEAVRSNAAEVLIATEVARIFRRVLEALEFIELASGTTLRWIEITNGKVYDLRTAAGVAELIAEVNKAAFETGNLSERVKRATRAKAKEGRFHGGMRPYGYEKDGVTVRADEAMVIRECIQRILDGQPIKTIVRILNQRGTPTCNGKRWTPSKLKAIVTSPRIVGIRTHLGEEYPAVWPALVSREDWEQARLLVQDTSRRTGQKRARKYLFTGFIFCGVCEKPLIGNTYYPLPKSQGGKPQRSYRCHTSDIYGLAHGCGKVRRMADPVELFVSELVLKRYSSPTFAEAIRRAYQDSGHDQLSAYLEEAQTYRLKIQKVEEAYKSSRPGMDLDTMLRIKLDLEEALEAIHAKVARHSTGRVLAAIPAGENVHEAWDKADFEQRRALVSLIVRQIVLLPGRPGRKRWHHKATGQTFAFDPERVLIEWKF
jgi:DNA invertase Pin-like site-specific DNA recombinase